MSRVTQKFSKNWRREPLHVIQFFRRLAEIGKESHKEAFPNYKYRPRKCGRELKRTTAITPPPPKVTIPSIINFTPVQTPAILLFSNLEDLDFYLNNFYSNFYSSVISQILSIIYSDINFFIFI